MNSSGQLTNGIGQCDWYDEERDELRETSDGEHITALTVQGTQRVNNE